MYLLQLYDIVVIIYDSDSYKIDEKKGWEVIN